MLVFHLWHGFLQDTLLQVAGARLLQVAGARQEHVHTGVHNCFAMLSHNVSACLWMYSRDKQVSWAEG